MFPFEHGMFSDDHCFLCGKQLDTKSREHIFAEWLLNEANLWKKTAFLPNGTTLPYRQCVIPCCVPCNTRPLSKLEGEVQRAFAGGAAEVKRLDPTRLSLWMSKMYFGVQRRCHTLAADRSDPSLGPLMPAEILQTFKSLHTFLQRIRLGDKFVGPDPDSTFVCDVWNQDEPFDFDWMAGFFFGTRENARIAPAFAIRHRGVGVITLFGDGGAQKAFMQGEFDWLTAGRLHPVQFLELACMAFYQHSLFSDQIGYAVVYFEDGRLMVTPHYPPHGRVWNEWEPEEFTTLLLRHLKSRPHYGVINWSEPADRQPSFLFRDDGSLIPMGANGQPLNEAAGAIG